MCQSWVQLTFCSLKIGGFLLCRFNAKIGEGRQTLSLCTILQTLSPLCVWNQVVSISFYGWFFLSEHALLWLQYISDKGVVLVITVQRQCQICFAPGAKQILSLSLNFHGWWFGGHAACDWHLYRCPPYMALPSNCCDGYFSFFACVKSVYTLTVPVWCLLNVLVSCRHSFTQRPLSLFAPSIAKRCEKKTPVLLFSEPWAWAPATECPGQSAAGNVS